MNIDKNRLQAAGQGVVEPSQIDTIWQNLEAQNSTAPKLEFAQVAYYSGAVMVISAMTWLMNSTWDRFGGWGLFLISIVYGLGFLFLGYRFWNQPNRQIPGGLFVTMAVCMAPLAIYGLERAFGLWPVGGPSAYAHYYSWLRGNCILLEAGTIVAGLSAMHFFRFPFITAPVVLATWCLSMDLVPLLFGHPSVSFDMRLWVSLFFGSAMIITSYIVDRKATLDYAFWGYLLGVFAFWCGFSFMDVGNEWTRFGYFLINVALIWLSIFLQRRIFIILGALGVMGYIYHLAYSIFAHSLLFPFVLSGLGMGVIYLGLFYQRHQVHIDKTALSFVPERLRTWVPSPRQ